MVPVAERCRRRIRVDNLNSRCQWRWCQGIYPARKRAPSLEKKGIGARKELQSASADVQKHAVVPSQIECQLSAQASHCHRQWKS
jgi:hypothetical protein